MEGNLQAGEIFFLMAIGVLIMVALALSFVLFFNRTQKKLLEEKNKSQALQIQHQKELLHGTILTQEKERKRIAKDLHDDIGSKLNVIHLNMHRLKKMGGTSSDFEDTIKEVNGLIHKTIDTTRRISHDLLPPTLDDFGLIEAIKELSNQYQNSGEVDVDFNYINEREKRLDKLEELSIFRVLQELVKNSVLHGEAEKVDIDLNLHSDKVSVHYKDNGKGFEMEKPEKKGLGLRNIESRLNMIGAQLDFQSALGKGVSVNITKPLNNESD